MKKLLGMTKIGLVLTFGLASGALAQDFCSNAQHSGQSVKISSNQTGKIGNIGYELWDENGHGGDATIATVLWNATLRAPRTISAAQVFPSAVTRLIRNLVVI